MSRKNKETLEKRVVDALLERDSDVLRIDGEEFPIAPPTVATLMLVSEVVAELPIVNGNADNALVEVLATAKDMGAVGKITAILILGAKRVHEKRMITIREAEERWRWTWRGLKKVLKPAQEVTEVEWLARKVLDEVSPKELLKIVQKRLLLLEVGDFFGLTTSLSEANQLRATREVETHHGEK